MKLCVLVLKWEKALGLVIEVPISAWPFQGEFNVVLLNSIDQLWIES